MGRPLVSVITATYNSSRTLQLTLSSLVAQTFQDWEAWVIGDGCTDDSARVVESFRDPRLHWVNLDHNHGSQAFANNEGLRRANGSYVAYLGHDDLWMPNHLAELVRCIEAYSADLVHSICALLSRDGWSGCVGPPKDHLGYDCHFVPPSCWLHRREIVESVGFWSSPLDIAVPVDVEYLRRIARAKKKIACCPQLTVVKTPSWWVSLYSSQNDLPQEACWKKIQSDPNAFLLEISGPMALALAKLQAGGYDSFGTSCRNIAGIIKRNFRAITEKWPGFASFWRWRHQLARKRMAAKRGLEMNSSGQMKPLSG